MSHKQRSAFIDKKEPSLVGRQVYIKASKKAFKEAGCEYLTPNKLYTLVENSGMYNVINNAGTKISIIFTPGTTAHTNGKFGWTLKRAPKLLLELKETK